MKTSLAIYLLVLAYAVPSSLCFAGEDVSPMIQGEIAKLESELQSGLGRAKKALQDLYAQRTHAVEMAKNQAKGELSGLEALRKYNLLLTGRYTNERGEYQAGMELNSKDYEIINKIFEAYLHSTPLYGRVSVGHARRTIDWGMKRLDEMYKTHSEPTELNNSELEIIAKQILDSEVNVRRVTELATRLGVQLKDEALADSDARPAAGRKPASDKK